MKEKQHMFRKLNSPSDTVFGENVVLGDVSLMDFWKWGFSDLCDDDVKGFFAEWLVHKLLGIQSARRISWANSDVLTVEGVTLEVKATAFWQSWKWIDGTGKQRTEPSFPATDESKVRFGGLTARNADGVADSASARTLKSHLYVFAFQHETDYARWNAMDLSQWEFYIFPAVEIPSLGGRSITLQKLRSRQSPMTAADFIKRARELIVQQASTLKENALKPAL
jgi:hypothetical protein